MFTKLNGKELSEMLASRQGFSHLKWLMGKRAQSNAQWERSLEQGRRRRWSSAAWAEQSSSASGRSRSAGSWEVGETWATRSW